MSQIRLMKLATIKFPKTEYTDAEAVRHARREWLKAVAYLRNRPESAWVIDQKVERKHEQDSYLLCRQAG